MPNSHDRDIRDLMERADAATRKEWEIMRAEHETRLQDQRSIWDAQGMADREMTQRHAELRAELEAKEERFIEAVQEKEALRLAALQAQDLANSRFIAEETLRQDAIRQEEMIHSQFIADDFQRHIDQDASRATLKEQEEKQRWADFQREEERRNQEILDRQAAGTLEPVSFERHVEADAKVFDDRREEVKAFCEEQRDKEIAKALEGVEDQRIAAEEAERVRVEWARLEAERLEAIAREQAARLERTRALYDR